MKENDKRVLMSDSLEGFLYMLSRSGMPKSTMDGLAEVAETEVPDDRPKLRVIKGGKED